MSSSYFNVIFTNDFCINVALFIIDFLFTRLPISGLLVDLPSYVPEGIVLTIIYFLSYYLIYANFYSITLICINRMSSVVFPYSCNSFWQRFVTPAIALIYILPLLTTWQMFTYNPYFLALYENRSNYQMVYRAHVLITFLVRTYYGDLMEKREFQPRNSASLCFASILLSVVCVIANVVTIIKYKMTVQSVMATSGAQKAFHRKRTRRVEIAMFSVALVVCLSLVLQAILQILFMR
ncbi:hypothetical protein CRE_01141 [Caenorhabditis remanei]|uniref:Serpentine receptor class gamma n=1 Tax=Caenorhabditis remanei TaxID=31234 RepID=E3MWE4_CAERE|nr:hypothetical protein CRE_01141 [Caenorhabditis remanei]